MRLAWPGVSALLVAVAAACSSFSSEGASGDTTPDGGVGPDGAVVPPGTPPPPGPGACAIAELRANPPTTGDCGGQAGLDLTKSKNNCGRCGHACDTSCSGGACVAIKTYSDPDPLRNDYWVYEVTGGKAYISTQRELRRVDISGAPVETIAVTQAGYAIHGYAYDGTVLYTQASGNANATEIGKVGPPDDAGLPAVQPLLLDGNLAGFGLASAGDSLFTASYISLVSVKKADGTKANEFTGQPGATIEGPVAQGGEVIWIEGYAGEAGPRYFVHVRTPAGDFVTRADEDGVPDGLAVDDTHIYWTESDAQVVVRIDRRTQDPPEVIARWPSDLTVVKGLAIDADHVYWVAGKLHASGDQDNVIFSAPKCAGPSDEVTVVERPGGAFNGGLAADGTHVFFTGVAGLWRVSK